MGTGGLTWTTKQVLNEEVIGERVAIVHIIVETTRKKLLTHSFVGNRSFIYIDVIYSKVSLYVFHAFSLVPFGMII
jgi:hypothetical protein